MSHEGVVTAISHKLPVTQDVVFGCGAYLVGQVEAVLNFDQDARRPDGSRPQQLDKETGLPLWQVAVLDADPEAGNREKTVVVKLVAEHQPVPPANTSGLPFTPVRFTGLTLDPVDRRQRSSSEAGVVDPGHRLRGRLDRYAAQGGLIMSAVVGVPRQRISLARVFRGVRTGLWLAWVVFARLTWAMWCTKWWFALCGITYVAAGSTFARWHMHALGFTVQTVYALPLVVGVVWSMLDWYSFERRVAGPWRRRKWRRWARKNWDDLARECGLSVQRTKVKKVTRTVRVGDHTETVREPQQVT